MPVIGLARRTSPAASEIALNQAARKADQMLEHGGRDGLDADQMSDCRAASAATSASAFSKKKLIRIPIAAG